MRLQVVSDAHLSEHHHLTSDDDCYFFGEFTAGRDNWTPVKSLVHNLKKLPGEVGYSPYKAEAIEKAINYLAGIINSNSIEKITLVPVPPSKRSDDPKFDDRIWTVLCGLQEKLKGSYRLDIRKLIYQTESYQASHTTVNRITPQELEDIYRVDEDSALPEPSMIIVIDDVLTSGCHYRAMHSVLSKRFPSAKIKGIFLARRRVDYGAIFGSPA